MAGGKSVQGAYLIVTALTRSVRDIVPKYGMGNPSPTRGPMVRQYLPPGEGIWGAYLANGALPGGEGGNDTQRTLHE